MTGQTVFRRHRPRFVPYLAAFAFAFSARAQTPQKAADPSGRLPEKEGEITVIGCLDSRDGAFTLSDFAGNVYLLTGESSELSKCVGEGITVRGRPDESIQPHPTLAVLNIVPRPNPTLSRSFRRGSSWKTQTNSNYGMKLAHPGFPHVPADESYIAGRPNFVASRGAVVLSSFEIPSETYPHTNFVGGYFAVFANPEINDRKSCEQFGEPDRRDTFSTTLGGIQYSGMQVFSAAAGTYYADYYFHTFQNGLCYEVAFNLGEYNTANQDDGCMVPVLTERDDLNLMEPLIARVSYRQLPAKKAARQR